MRNNETFTILLKFTNPCSQIFLKICLWSSTYICNNVINLIPFMVFYNAKIYPFSFSKCFAQFGYFMSFTICMDLTMVLKMQNANINKIPPIKSRDLENWINVFYMMVSNEEFFDNPNKTNFLNLPFQLQSNFKNIQHHLGTRKSHHIQYNCAYLGKAENIWDISS